MHIRLNRFTVGSGGRAGMEKVADQVAPIFRAQNGFRRVTFFEADPVAGEYGSFSIWETNKDAEADDAALMLHLQQALSGAGLQLQAGPSRRIGEVYEPGA